MNTSSTTAPYSGGVFSVLRRAQAWLDDKGKGAWLAAMVLGFIFVWPVGLGLLAYMIWSKRMFNRSSCAERRARHQANWGQRGHWGPSSMRSSGNAAFDAYKTDMLRRLEDEQTAFESFLQRLREAKDKSEFDNFMEERARAASTPAAAAPSNGDVTRSGEY
ncbi:DUF2852 domain-containing protein [Cypionkella sp.]|uniref:DUF2852 domain-containing protein n=1 Tax=Cypionkella sp. TaxID=2811411 RepID=UPI0026356E5D|nr:DUF2852 domain-containing protein [Cypionkella sp.]MDB5665107.1 hypothetical protein [Cypionkella sp.]